MGPLFSSCHLLVATFKQTANSIKLNAQNHCHSDNLRVLRRETTHVFSSNNMLIWFKSIEVLGMRENYALDTAFTTPQTKML